MKLPQPFTFVLPTAITAGAGMAAFAIGSQAFAAEMSHGEMAAAIRNADYPCAHVIALESAGAEAWSVECNAGKYRVTREKDGSFSVEPIK